MYVRRERERVHKGCSTSSQTAEETAVGGKEDLVVKVFGERQGDIILTGISQ